MKFFLTRVSVLKKDETVPKKTIWACDGKGNNQSYFINHIWIPADFKNKTKYSVEQCSVCGIVQDTNIGTRWYPEDPFDSMHSLVHYYCVKI